MGDHDAKQLGPAKLTVAVDSDGRFSMTLKDKSGAEFKRSTPLTDTSCGDGECFNSWRAGFPDVLHGFSDNTSREVSIYNYYESGEDSSPLYYFQATFYADGGILGLANGLAFRNSVLASGPAVPAILGALAGTYSGKAAGLCGDDVGSLTLGADGTLQLTGKTMLSCVDQDISATWDGNDDLLIPVGDAARLLIDSYNQGGSLPTGGITLELSTQDAAAELTQFEWMASGGGGGIRVAQPTKE